MTVWDDLVGQEPAVAVLKKAVDGATARLQGASGAATAGMTHAWLITGPPGSGRSNAGRAFAAALQCENQGCGECAVCRTALSGAHPDVSLIRTELLSIRVSEIRELVRRAAMRPTQGRWQVMVVEDADRLTEQAADALLKSIEEPSPRTVWVLCAPTVEDVVPTIRSRCRLLVLRTPPVGAVAEMLTRKNGVEPELAGFAARAAQGHIGRAKALARDEEVRSRRSKVLEVPFELRDIGACLNAAQRLVDAAKTESKASAAKVDEQERAELEQALGMGTKGAKPRETAAALKELEDQQKARAKRWERDVLDRSLVDMMALYRDVLVLQTGAGSELINAELRRDIEQLAGRTSPEQTIRRIDALTGCREAIEGNVAPLLALEAMTIALFEG
ncbi:DNA polymerase-3 subunit delta' [Kribbella orskensis]|uniref:DNA polymerase III subunit delta' n=1 Tax=Kribbella orskensis TaxID=2512216 RepID=A0ABY2BIV6_9ACTN|nr:MULTISPECIES: DNA polymerase III subunit delta' [Kribbella]TCN39112.1 DNA polymerase-3 subunit delta' [Kribbella sp. VKM Ac-2500]TCO21759.1 DNA polymerase-3 subunit delta' [Kribbella orskensis]